MKLPGIKKNTLSLTGCEPSCLPQEVLLSSRPIILKGVIKSWPITQIAEKSKDELKRYIGGFYSGEPVVTMNADSKTQGRYFYNERCDGFNFTSTHSSLKDVLDHAGDRTAGSFKYAGSVSLDRYLPGLSDENSLSLDEYSPIKSIWVGNQSRISCHFDVPQNIACCVSGKRRFTLFPPEQVSNLYIGPLDLTPAGQAISLVDFDQPDYQKFPRFKDAQASAEIAELEPGDALLLPSMWWHHVESRNDLNVLINYWWTHSPNYLGRGFDALYNTIFSIRDLPAEQKKAWKALFDHYVFDNTEAMNGHIPVQARSLLSRLDEDQARLIRTQLLRNLNR